MARTTEEFKVLPPILPISLPNRDTLQKLRWAIDVRYLNLHGVGIVETDRERLDAILGQFDLVWVLNGRTPNILQRWHWHRAHLDIDDVPSTYLRTVAQNGSGMRERWKARVQQTLLRRREVLLIKRFTTLSVCSHADKAYLNGSELVHVIPNGFERPKAVPRLDFSEGPRIGFIGLFSYLPNLDGVAWFLRECWPAIRGAVPEIRLRLVGRGSEAALQSADPTVDALGWVEDPSAEIATWSAMIIPIRFGGGTRIKIAEAFSRKCPAVSTSTGAFGYEVEHGRQLLIADRGEDFAHACIKLVRNRDFGGAIAAKAWNDYIGKWTWEAIAPRVWRAAEDCLRRSHP